MSGMKQKNKAVVFTDLDGTFLDHHSYEYTDALPAVRRLQSLGVPIIPVTSKTLLEIQKLSLPFGDTPQVAENGMVIADLNGQHDIDKSYAEILTFVTSLPEDIRANITGFNDMSVTDIALQTSLPQDKAKLAKDRLASEPFLWSGNNVKLEQLKKLAENADLAITRGGRFYHLMGRGGKDQAILSLIAQYKKQNENIISIALGDGPNDATMLACVDYGIKIPNENGHDFEVHSPRGTILKAKASGPKGWNIAINTLLDDLPL